MNRSLKIIRFLITLLTVVSIALSASADEFVIHRFQPGHDGKTPSSGLVQDALGNLYGVTAKGGSAGDGTVYQLAPPVPPGGAWTETVLYSFTGHEDGVAPVGNLLFDGLGNLYGVTEFGGGAPNCSTGCGTVFELSPPSQSGGAWSESVLFRFTQGDDGGVPTAGLIIDSAGNLYGTASQGGTLGYGVVFQLALPGSAVGLWTETVLYSFQGGEDGMFPSGSLVFDLEGNLYGTTAQGGSSRDYGTVFQLSPPQAGGNWTETIIHAFDGSDGRFPQSGLVINNAGDLAGTTPTGGANSVGEVFGLQHPAQAGDQWKFVILHSFTGGAFDGDSPASGLALGRNNVLYGTTAGGGTANFGTIFQVSHSGCCGWNEQALYSFPGGPGGSDPGQPLLVMHGALYGTTTLGGNPGNQGLAFRFH